MPSLSDFYISSPGALTLPVNTVTYNDGGTTNLDHVLGNVFNLTANGTGTTIGHLNVQNKRYSFELHLQWISGTITWPSEWTKGDAAPTTTGGYVITGTTVDGGISWKISVLDAPSGIVTDSLVLHLDAGQYDSYPGSGTTWTDLAGSNNGTLTNGPSYSSTNGGSIVFDGTDNYSTGSTTGLPSDSSARTIEIWASPGATADAQSALAYGVNSNGRRISISANQDKFSVGVNGHEYGKNGLSLTGWQHFLLLYPGGGNSSTFEFYINSVQQTGLSNLAGSAQTVNTTISTNPLLIGGGLSPTPTFFYDGNIASVRIYSRALSAAEIEQNFEATRGRFGI